MGDLDKESSKQGIYHHKGVQQFQGEVRLGRYYSRSRKLSLPPEAISAIRGMESWLRHRETEKQMFGLPVALFLLVNPPLAKEGR